MRNICGSCFALVLALVPLTGNAGQCDAIAREDALLECLGTEFGAVDKELNSAYVKLRVGLTKEQKEMLTKAQKLWVSLRDADCDFEADSHNGGTGFQAVYLQCQIDKTKRRTAEFKGSLFWPNK